MDSSMFKGFDTFVLLLFIFAIIGLIFGVWKLIEIIIWMFSHLHWS